MRMISSSIPCASSYLLSWNASVASDSRYSMSGVGLAAFRGPSLRPDRPPPPRPWLPRPRALLLLPPRFDDDDDGWDDDFAAAPPMAAPGNPVSMPSDVSAPSRWAARKASMLAWSLAVSARSSW
jgi:hypothetical protein